MAKAWYSWTSDAAFDAWHTAVVNALNLPRVGVNQATGEPEPDAQWTTAYTEVTEVGSDDWRAPVEDDVAAAHPVGLGGASEPPPAPPMPPS